MLTRDACRLCLVPRAAVVLVLVLALESLAGCAGARANGHWLSNLIEPMFPPTPQEAARDAFNVYDADKRRRAVALLSAAPFGGDPEYVRMYRLLITDRDASVRAACARALGRHGSVEDAGLIIPLLGDEDVFVRWEAAKALQRIHNPAAVEPLMRVVQSDEDVDVRMAAAKALGQYPQRRVFDVLVGALNDRNFGVVEAARESLATLTGQDLGPDSALWLAWAQEHRDTLFASRRPYTFTPYVDPPGILERVQFWKKPEQAMPQAPTGWAAEAPDADRG